MIVTTTLAIEGYRVVEYKGVVRGLVVRSPTILQGILGGFKNIVGGNISSLSEMCEQARQQAYDLMVEHAMKLGANAVIAMQYSGAEVASRYSATEVLCYGTAVVLAKLGM